MTTALLWNPHPSCGGRYEKYHVYPDGDAWGIFWVDQWTVDTPINVAACGPFETEYDAIQAIPRVHDVFISSAYALRDRF